MIHPISLPYFYPNFVRKVIFMVAFILQHTKDQCLPTLILPAPPNSIASIASTASRLPNSSPLKIHHRSKQTSLSLSLNMTDSKKYSNKLAGARVLVIGGSSGIGYCVAEACLESGATVTISSSRQSRIDASVDRLLQTYPSARGRVAGYACDLSTPSVEANIVDLLDRCCGGDADDKTMKLDHIVHTAGDALATLPLADATLELIQRAAMVRFNSPLLLAKHAPAYLNPGPTSSLTLTTGSISRKPSKDWSVVASYAAGLHGMMRNLALDLAPRRVNLVSPGLVLTPLWEGLEGGRREAFLKRVEWKCTTGRVGRPEDVAEGYIYLMRDRNVTGVGD